MLLSDLIPAYRDYLKYERQLRPQTVQAYTSDVRGLDKHLPGVHIGQVTVDDLRRYLRQMSKDGLHTNTIRRRFHGFGTFYEWLILEGHTDQNLAHKVRLPKKREGVPRWLTPAELAAFVTTPAAGRYRVVRERHQAAWHALAWLGLRRSELLKLQVQDVRLAESLVLIRDTKSGHDRLLPLVDQLGHELGLCIAGRGAGPVFCTRAGRPWKPSDFMVDFRHHLERAGLAGRGITPHALRHTFATTLIRSGIPLSTVSRLLGHRDIKSTMIYVHDSNDDLKLALEAMTS